ncbi:MAG TPA: 50S ribosomal protein L9 [Gammaproteobacteria bacterium]|nr:50S ribosomal protein L9 [Gammaproteobacteria bacterium]
MEIILLEKIRNLGDLGAQVSVKPGYGRNYLIPQGKAVRATKENKKIFESRRTELEANAMDALAKAEARAAELENVAIEIARRASEEGKLFGSVTISDIIEAVAVIGKELDKVEVNLPEGAIKVVGEHIVDISLHPEVNLSLKVTVISES